MTTCSKSVSQSHSHFPTSKDVWEKWERERTHSQSANGKEMGNGKASIAQIEQWLTEIGETPDAISAVIHECQTNPSALAYFHGRSLENTQTIGERSMKEISAALVKAQKAFGPALKSSTNPHFKSRYAALDACVDAVIDGLNGAGIALVQKTLDCTDGVMVETVFIHESGETLSCGVLHVPAVKSDPQGYGSALTYARRYSLMAACGIAPEDDDGEAATRASRGQPAFDLKKIVASITEAPTHEEAKAIARDAWAKTTNAIYQKQIEDAVKNYATKESAA